MDSIKKGRVEQQLNILREVGRAVDKNASVLDLGCGNGETVKAYRDKSFDCYGADIRFKDGSNVAYLEKEGYIRTINPADYRLPFEDNSFDLVLSDQVFEHVQDYDGALSEIRRVLKHDGQCLSFFPSRYSIIEVHVFVPLATIIQSYWWLRLWAGLGVRKPNQIGLKAEEVARSNYDYLTQNTNYLSKREIKKFVKVYFSNVEFAEDAFLKYSFRGSLVKRFVTNIPLFSVVYGAIRQRVMLFW